MIFLYLYTVKKGLRFSRPQPGCHSPNSPWPGIIKLFPARESLVSDIPAGVWKIDNLFYSVATKCPNQVVSLSSRTVPLKVPNRENFEIVFFDTK
jgi:hypothetical protein